MNFKTWIPLLLAIVLGLIAAKVAKDALNKDKKPVAQSNLTSIVITKRPLPPGKEIVADDLSIGQVSPESAPERGFSNVSELLGRVVKVEMVKGQAVVEPLLTESGTTGGLSSQVPMGMRAITIEVNEFSGVAGMVLPGSRVDVVATIQGSGDKAMSARTIVQNVKITAVGQRLTAQPDPKEDPQQTQVFRSVTLLCLPEEAEAIELATTSGRPWLVLRGGKDDVKVASRGITIDDLRGSSNSGKSADPFRSTPVLNVTPMTTPTTQAQSTEPMTINSRTIQVIRGGIESSVTIMLPVENATTAE